MTTGNADFNTDGIKGPTYLFIDGAGGVRQISEAVKAINTLGAQSLRAASFAASAIPIGLLVTGPLSALTAALWTIPEAVKDLRAAQKEKYREALTSARLGLANQVLYGTMGLSQSALGAITLASPTAAHALHMTAGLHGAAATTATLAAGLALGAIYLIRGGVMLTRSLKNYNIVAKFEEDWNKAKTIEDKLEVFNRLTPDERQRRTGLKEAPEAKAIQAIDKGIYATKFKQRISMIIAFSMIVGGVLSFILPFLGVGHLGTGFLLTSAVSFIAMEFIFFTYDSSKLMNKIIGKLYTPSEPVRKLLGLPEPFSLVKWLSRDRRDHIGRPTLQKIP